MGISIGGAVIPEKNFKYITGETLSANAASSTLTLDLFRDGNMYMIYGTFKGVMATAGAFFMDINADSANLVGRSTSTSTTTLATADNSTNELMPNSAQTYLDNDDIVSMVMFMKREQTSGYLMIHAEFNIRDASVGGRQKQIFRHYIREVNENITSIKFYVSGVNNFLAKDSDFKVYGINDN